MVLALQLLDSFLWPQPVYLLAKRVRQGSDLILDLLHFTWTTGLIWAWTTGFIQLSFDNLNFKGERWNTKSKWFSFFVKASTTVYSWGQQWQCRQNNNTNYTRQKVHMNIWNKADVCAVLLSNETWTDPVPRCLQNVLNIFKELVLIFFI